MHTPDPATPGEEAQVMQAMVALATLAAALEVRFRRAERNAGRDPSAQQAAAVAMPALRTITQELDSLLLRLRAGLILEGEDHAAALVRHLDGLLTLSRLAALLHEAHQHLLSLYPAVGPDLIETARNLHAEAAERVEADLEPDHLLPFIRRGLRFTAWMWDEL